MEQKIRENIRLFREKARLSQRKLADLIGKSESAVQGYENGKTDIPLSSLVAIAGALKVTFAELSEGKKEKKPVEKEQEIKVYNLEERMSVATILIKNGYTVRQGKRLRTPTGKTLDYILYIQEDERNADTTR